MSLVKAIISNQRRSISMSVKAIILISLLSGIGGVANADGSLTALELQGRKIYREGSDGSEQVIAATFGLTEDSAPATLFACANCHGLEGEGKREGGLVAPALKSQQLLGTTTSNPQAKPGYNETTFLKAITKGINAKNELLSTAMPRYQLTDSQTQALFAYLKRLSTTADAEVGIASSEVQLGTLLPLTGTLENIGKTLKATLDACVAEVNKQGLIYGRKLTLTAVDSGSTPAENFLYTQRLLANSKPFALTAAYLPEISPGLLQALAKEKIPLIAPLTFIPDDNANPAYANFYFLPSYVNQARALVDYWLSHLAKEQQTTRPKLAIVRSDRKVDTDVATAIREQLNNNGLTEVMEISLPQSSLKPATVDLKRLKLAKPDALFFIGTGKELAFFAKLMPKKGRQPMLLGLLAMLGTELINFPGLSAGKILLANPFDLNVPQSPEFLAIMKKYSVGLQSPGLQRIACASVNFVAEGLKRTGKHLTRDKFVRSLEETNSFPMEIMPPMLGLNRRQGIKGAYILTVDSKTGTFSSISERLSPKLP